MTADLFIHQIEVKAKKIDFKEYLLNIVSGHVSSYNVNFKIHLKDLLTTLEDNAADLNSLSELGEKELKKLNFKFRKYNRLFDKINDLYYSSNYFGDDELKDLFRSISRRLHKIENLSYKYLNQSNNYESTPQFIKDGLSKFSKDSISQKLNPLN